MTAAKSWKTRKTSAFARTPCTTSRSRRNFLRCVASALTANLVLPRLLRAKADSPRIRFAVIGINHEHIFRMVEAVRGGGGELAMIFADKPDPIHGAKFLRENADVKQAREEREVLEADGISLVISAIRPANRAALGVRVMRAGKDFLADKGGFLNLESLAEAQRVQTQTKRIYAISYNERLLLPVSQKIDELLKSGAIGRVTGMTGLGPHGLLGHGPREDWFWTRAGHGGILLDVGTHQADDFLHYMGSDGAEVASAQVGNFENPDHPEFEDWGRMTLRSKAGTGKATVTFYTGKNSPGFLLNLDGEEGRMEVHKREGRITVIGRNGQRKEYRVDSKLPCPFGRQLVDDIVNRTETVMPQAHTFLASELAVRAQLTAKLLKDRPADDGK